MNHIALVVLMAFVIHTSAAFAQESPNTASGLKGSISINEEIEWARYIDFAHIKINEAIRIALKKHNGTPIMAQLIELEEVLIWYVYIVNSSYEIEKIAIDAGNGKVLRIDTYNDKRNE